MKRFFYSRISNWLKKRIPARSEQTLDHSKIFIFPSRFGVWFLMLSGLLFVLGTNYQNNLMRLLCTFLLALFLLHLFVSYINFSRLRIKALPHIPAYAKSQGSLPVAFYFGEKPAQGIIHMAWWRDQENQNSAVSLNENPSQGVMPFYFEHRGTYRLPRLTIRCDFPLGLFKCWTHLDLDQTVLIYPNPKPCDIKLVQAESKHKEAKKMVSGGHDEYAQLRSYQPSDSLNHVAWKQAAKSQDWLVKTFEQPSSASGILTMQSTQSMDLEGKLSELTFQILELSRLNTVFGLSIPTIDIEPGSGERHMHKCLAALANLPMSVKE